MTSDGERPGGRQGICSRDQCVRPWHLPFCSGLSSRDLTTSWLRRRGKERVSLHVLELLLQMLGGV